MIGAGAGAPPWTGIDSVETNEEGGEVEVMGVGAAPSTALGLGAILRLTKGALSLIFAST